MNQSRWVISDLECVKQLLFIIHIQRNHSDKYFWLLKKECLRTYQMTKVKLDLRTHI